MRKLWKYAFANIKKTKSASLTLFIMFFIAAFLLNVGLLVLFNYQSHFANLTKELNASDLYYSITSEQYTDDVKDYFFNDPNITQIEDHEGLFLEPEITFKKKSKEFKVLFLNKDTQRTISKWKYVGKYLETEDMGVYVPDYFRAVGGYQLNDEIKLTYLDKTTNQPKELVLTIKGYIEDIYFSSLELAFASFYVSEQTYNILESALELDAIKTHILYANVLDLNAASKLVDTLNEYLKANHPETVSVMNSLIFMVLDLGLVKLSRTIMASMVAILMVVFAVIVVIVCLLVVRFRIINTVEEDVVKIGSLKATGYTNKEIMLSLLIQFLSIASLGSVLGLFSSYFSLPAVSYVFQQQSGLRWVQGFDPFISLVVILFIIVVVASVAYFAARKVNRLSVINALRGDFSVKAQQKNRLPLEKTKSNITFFLAIKSIFQNIKQNIMIIIIIIAVGFFGSFGIVLFYNTTVNTNAFAEVPGMELSSVLILLNPSDNHDVPQGIINDISGVKKTLYIDQRKAFIDDVNVEAFIMDDFFLKETKKVYKGHYPDEVGQIAIAGYLADRLNKKIGDSVLCRVGENSLEFVIVGLTSGANMGGLNAFILAEDFIKVDINFKKNYLHVYLDKTIDNNEFILEAENRLGSQHFLMAIDMEVGLEEGMSMYINVVVAMGIVMIVITVLVIFLVLYFIISSTITRKKKELGIQKAIGFTTFQLMNQFALAFIIPIIIGVIIGGTVGSFAINPFLGLTMKGMGVYDPKFIVEPLWIFAFCTLIVTFSYLLSLLITFKIRKVSAYMLVTE